jgi:hypothetical protein
MSSGVSPQFALVVELLIRRLVVYMTFPEGLLAAEPIVTYFELYPRPCNSCSPKRHLVLELVQS